MNPTPTSPTTTDPQTPPASSPSAKMPALSTGLVIIGFFEILAGGVGVLLIFSGGPGESQLGWILAPVGITGGLVLVALAKAVDYLHDAVYHLRNIQQLLERR